MSFNVTGSTNTIQVANIGGDTTVNSGAVSYGRSAVTMSDATTVLSAAQSGNLFLDLSGSLTAVRQLTMPLVAGAWYWVRNACSWGVLAIGAVGNGVLIGANSTAKIMCDGTNWIEDTQPLFYVQSAAGSAVTATASETQAAVVAIPANILGLGSVLRVRYQGVQTAVNGTDTVTVKVRFGATTLTGTVVVSGAAITGNNAYGFQGQVEFVVRAAPSASSAIVASGWYVDPAATASGTFKQVWMATTNFATNAALLCEVTIQFSSSNAGNSARVDVMNAELI